MDIVVWLRSLGLGKYEAAFRENDIDETVLPGLTHEILKELGVASIGHRVKLLDAVAALRSDASGKAPSADVATTSTTPSASPEDRAERRQVTVMFSDLVGSTALSARMDPEDLREVISTYQKCVTETVQRFGGFVAKFMGDGVLIYFGYPQAHEDDAERAVRAGLELVAAIGALKTHAPLQTRVGIATGLVVVGDLIGSGASQEQAIVGETPNLAARLQGVAEPDSVVIAESTRRLVGNLFELEDLGAKDLKGVEGPVRAWVALRSSSVESRFEALHTGGFTELVGREEELEILLRRWSKAKSGEGQVVLLSGEPGIGKSRLTAALLERLAREPHTRLRYFCSPQHTDSAFFPIIRQMERAAGFAQDDTVQAKLDKLDALMAQSHTPRQDIALFADMLSLPNDGRYPNTRPNATATSAKNACSPARASRDICRQKACVDDLGGCALGRSHKPRGIQRRCGSDCIPTRPADHNIPARVRSAVDWTATRHFPDAQSAHAARNRSDDRPRRWQQPNAGEHSAGNHRAHRRYSALRRGNDQSSAGSG